jgi:aquaporin NIP
MKQYTSELIGTFALVFFGTGAIMVNEISGGAIGHLGIAVAFGLVVLAVIYGFGEISGAHINPAVTIAFWVSGRFPKNKVLFYILAQLVGAILASIVLRILFPESITMGETLPLGTNWQSFALEFILTYFLMLVIINVSTGSKETGTMAGIAIGAVVFLEALVAGPICGASMNPARSIAPALISGNIQNLWLYIAAPILGAFLAVLSCKYLKGNECCK